MKKPNRHIFDYNNRRLGYCLAWFILPSHKDLDQRRGPGEVYQVFDMLFEKQSKN